MTIQAVQETYTLTITANSITSTDERFTMDNLGLGDQYKPLDAYYKTQAGQITRRKRNKNEKRISNQTLPRLACQIFEQDIISLSSEEKMNFPVCQYLPELEVIRGIYPSVEAFKKDRNSIEFMVYSYGNGNQLVIYCWNIFSMIIFVQKCLEKFGNENDKFILVYQEKEAVIVDPLPTPNGYINPDSMDLIESKNIIYRGAPGTGKSYLAKAIAADIISNGDFDDYRMLNEEQKKQVEFIQFHPSYDYSDFVEGLRPKINHDGSMGFELQDGIFKRFVARAKENLENSQKSKEMIEKELSVENQMAEYFADIELGIDELETSRGNKFYITGVDEKFINVSIPENKVSNQLRLNKNKLRKMLESGLEFTKVKDVTQFFKKNYAIQHHSYILEIFNDIKQKSTSNKLIGEVEKLKPYIFIIDEINRGEISKIFGELFFSVDPGYRGPAGEVSTQYANLHDNPNEKFYIPENVYIIGTMNDIDRSVDSFDFAMRRRFRFIEIKAEDRLEMLEILGEDEKEAILRMTALNDAISSVEELNENYHIGASYFLKLQTLDFEQLWSDYLYPLLQEYVRGMYDEENIMKNFEAAYRAGGSKVGDVIDGTEG